MTLDREAARKALLGYSYWEIPDAMEHVLNTLESCVRPAPTQTIDRDALKLSLQQFAEEAIEASESSMWPNVANQADDVLALLQPVDGVTLTRDEAHLVLAWKQDAGRHGFPMGQRDAKLAARLKMAL